MTHHPDFDPNKLSCADCKHCLLEEYGYSNYTTEGTEFYCLIKKHPDDGFDAWYGSDPRLNYAHKCGSYVKGEGIDMDCDHENYDELSAEDAQRYDDWGTHDAG